VVKPRKRYRLSAGPGTANDYKARLTCINLQPLPHSGIWQSRPNHLFRLLQRRYTCQIGARRHRLKILRETIGCETREHVTIFNLYRRTIFVVHEQQVEYLSALLHVQRFGHLTTCTLP
jgi:radical SAM superfamily enzyme YgiQ (UPF0313 family)